jgi:hypothetical protein
VLTGRPLRRAGVAIATKAGREAGRVVEVGAQRALLSLFAASADERVVAQIVDVDSGQRGARFAVWLNGLEDRVRVIAEDELDVSGRFVLAVSSEPSAMRWLGLHIGNLASHIECIVSEVALPRHVDEAIRARGFTLVRLGAERGYVRHGITMRRLRRRTQRFVAADAAARLSSRAFRMVEPLRARIRGPLVARAALLRQRVSVGSRNGRS